MKQRENKRRKWREGDELQYEMKWRGFGPDLAAPSCSLEGARLALD